MNQVVQYTEHAELRRAQRNLSREDIAFVVEHGRRVRGGGALHIFLGRQDIPDDRNLQRRFARLEGTILVISDEPDALVLITAYRNRRGFKQVRAKSKFDRRREGN